MKLVVVARAFWSDEGQANATREVTRELVKLGVELLVVLHADSHVDSLQEPVAQMSPVSIDVKHNFIGQRTPLGYYNISRRAARVLESLRKDARSECLIHSHHFFPSAFIRRSEGSPQFFLTTIHGTVEGEVKRFKREMPIHPRELLYRPSLMGSMYRDRALMRRSKGHFIALSPSNAMEIVREGVPSSRVHFITNGVDSDVFKPCDHDEARKQLGLPMDKQIVLTVNEIQIRKGIHTLVRAAHRIVKEVPETYFVIVGRTPPNALWYMSYLWRLLTKLNLHDYFRFTGFVPKEQLPLYLNSADIFALSSYAEGAPLVIPEAMACARVVVATEGAAAGYLPTNLVVEDGDYEGLAHRISYYLLNEKQRRQSAEGLRQKAVIELSWRRIAERTLALYRNVMADNKHALNSIAR